MCKSNTFSVFNETTHSVVYRDKLWYLNLLIHKIFDEIFAMGFSLTYEMVNNPQHNYQFHFESDVCVTEHHWYNNINSRLDATMIILLTISICSTCFGRQFRPSSGALDCVYSLWYKVPTENNASNIKTNKKNVLGSS